MQYRAEIDGIRALAVVMVLGYHAKLPGFAGGFIGVDIFFVLSGFLIAGLLRSEIERTGRLDLWRFAERRVRRLMPLMMVVGLLTAAAGWFVLIPPDYKDFGQSLVLGPLFLGNWLFWHEAGYFGGAAVNKPLLHLWSLGVEGQFYALMAGFGVLAAWRWKVAVCLAVAMAGVSFLLGLQGAVRWPDSAFYLLPYRLWEFAAGAALALIPPPKHAVWGWLGLALIGVGFAVTTGADAFPGVLALWPVCGTAMLLLARGAVRDVLSVRPMVWLGQRSYGIYLWHFPVFVLAAAVVPDLPLWWLVPPVVALAALSLPLIEVPFRKTWEARVSWRRTVGLATASCAVGLALHLSGGAMARLPEVARTPLRFHEAWAMPCHDVLWIDAVKEGQRCRIGADVAPRIALFGDSHAGHLTPALAPLLSERGQSALVYSRGWCAPIPAFGTDAPTRGPECAAFMQAAWAEVLGDPAITHVILSAQWANFTAGTREGLATVTYGDARAPAENAAAFARALEDLADQVEGGDRRLLIVEPVPEFGAPVPELLVRAAWTAAPLRAVAPVPYTARNGAAMASLDAFRRATSAAVVRPFELFCAGDGALCRIADEDGAPLYRDRGHLSSRGAAIVVDALSHWLPGAG